MIQTKNLTTAFANGTMLSFPDLNIKKGGQTLLLGPSGSGKTTLLSLLAGLLSPESGTIQVAGQSLDQLSTAQADLWRGQTIGFVFQSFHLIAALDAWQNINLAQTFSHTHHDPDELMADLHIAALKKQKPAELSFGERQRVAIARALIHRPPVILADEPTSGLDDANAKAVIKLLMDKAKATQATLVIASHDQRVSKHMKNVVELEVRA